MPSLPCRRPQVPCLPTFQFSPDLRRLQELELELQLERELERELEQEQMRQDSLGCQPLG